ncbi:hypothetical protein KP509_22G020100 [Ceratopteris richardii]|nr:hypothetical protein KP509_22G020100 [Ceratopteris richardii]
MRKQALTMNQNLHAHCRVLSFVVFVICLFWTISMLRFDIRTIYNLTTAPSPDTLESLAVSISKLHRYADPLRHTTGAKEEDSIPNRGFSLRDSAKVHSRAVGRANVQSSDHNDFMRNSQGFVSSSPTALLADLSETYSPADHDLSTPSHTSFQRTPTISITIANSQQDSCIGRYIYMQSLPAIFNQNLITNCSQYSPTWVDMCRITLNGGLGPVLDDDDGVLSSPHDGLYSWYNTEQFILDVLFHSKMKKYKCLTTNASEAELVYVPFYAGLDLTRYLWGSSVSERDRLSNALAQWLSEQPEWKRMQGRDHFLVTGKISWDFRRPDDNENSWGNKLLRLPQISEMSVLLIENSAVTPIPGEYAIPYPTYFHPHTDTELHEWQGRMRKKRRENLFAFAGASRPEFEESIRGELIEQCRSSRFCKLMECTRGKSKCNSPTAVLKLFQESIFCLQPAGDSYTRRSVFDTIISGCIPVFFNPFTAYTQYEWHLPRNHSTYSVFIPEKEIKAKKTLIEEVLRKIPSSQVRQMRKTVINLIPSVVYAHPDHELEDVRDGFDLAIEGLLAKVKDARHSLRLRAAWANNLINSHEISDE